MNRTRTTVGLLLLFAGILSAQTLTLDEARHIALTRGWQSRANKIDNTAREWQKRNAVANYLPQVTYNRRVF